jgi:hypothetical protein
LLQTTNDAETAFDRGQQDYNLAVNNLGLTRDRGLEDTQRQINDVTHQYNVLGHQQGDAAAAHGITSQGLLALSAQKRQANETHDQAPLFTQYNRINEDFGHQKTLLDLANARQFGGFEGHAMNDPLTGQPIFGDLATGLTRAGSGNALYQQGLSNQKIYGAQQGGYIYQPPKLTKTQAAKVGARIRGH